MLTQNSIFLLLLAVTLLSLVAVQTYTAIYCDRVVSTAAPVRQLDDLLAQIDIKRATLADIENDLAARRAALADSANAHAQLDATARKLREVNAEWNQMEERRAEIRSLRSEMEQTLARKLALDSELATARADLDVVQARLKGVMG